MRRGLWDMEYRVFWSALFNIFMERPVDGGEEWPHPPGSDQSITGVQVSGIHWGLWDKLPQKQWARLICTVARVPLPMIPKLLILHI